ncbi:hypothetical protein SLA2020_522220 [Shorea laevis]
MATRVASAESRADELDSKNRELQSALNRERAERASDVQAAKDETARAKEEARRAAAERDGARDELSSLRQRLAAADQNFARAEEALNRTRASHQRAVGIARAQGAEWLVGSAIFQDVVAVGAANLTTEIFNEVRGKVLHHRPDFPIRELAFVDGEDMDEEGKSLAPLADTSVRLRWELNEEGVPEWPPKILEEGEDPEGWYSFDSWVEGAPRAEPEPSSTPPNSQPVLAADAPEATPVRPSPARSPVAPAAPARVDVSSPVDLTGD